MRSRLLLLCLAAVTCCLVWGALAFAQTGEPNEGDGGGGPQPPSIDNHVTAFPFGEVLSKGQPFLCGQAADKKSGEADVQCHIEATITVKSQVARFVGLHSRVIAHGVAGDVVDHLENSDGDDQGRAYFLKLPASVKSKLRAKHIRAMGVHVTGTITTPSGKFFCGGDQPVASCSLKGPKNTIWAAGDGELVCWRLMPWYLATPAKWGKMCPRPHQI